jgi:hypothetical protein
MKGLLLFLPVLFGCSGSPALRGGNLPGNRTAFLVGDYVVVSAGEYAHSAGTVIEVDIEADLYRVRLNDRVNPVYVRSGLLRKTGGAAQAAQPLPGVIRAQERAYGTPPLPVSPSFQGLPSENGIYGRLAVLPVIGLDEYVAETLAWHLANEEAVLSTFNVVPITPQIRKNVMSEESYSAIYNAGEDLKADYILASFARHTGCQKMFITLVLNVHTREQIAGDFKKYNDIEDIPALFTVMTKKITHVVRSKNAHAPRLSIELMAVPPTKAALKNEAAVLTQMLAITMANSNTYSIFPRTDNIDAAMLDYETRRTTARKVFVNKEDVTPVEFVLSSKLDIFDSRNQILAEIVDISGNVLRKGAHINFAVIEDVPDLLGRLAMNIAR